MKSTHPDAIRCLKILCLLLSRGWTVEELAKRFKVDKKTIRRDLIAIRKSGWKLTHVVEEFNRRRWSVSQ